MFLHPHQNERRKGREKSARFQLRGSECTGSGNSSWTAVKQGSASRTLRPLLYTHPRVILQGALPLLRKQPQQEILNL